ncbi:site-specific integrase [Pseudomonas syringae pv. syringae]|uniref:site-specific integrase n=1 Tax=Pseudomonas syringae TaxID=317 RepID=UPI001F1147FB|nr:site-specific integrase [Pseudomonas syringae]MCH5551104.1 site-specific integrase [Pseudomonas syringae pv. syringae]
MPAQSPPNFEDSPRYQKVALKNVRLWEPCTPDEAFDWLADSDAADNQATPYPIRPIPLSDEYAPHLYVILRPDGALWQEGSIYLFEAMTELGMSQSSGANAAGDLADFMNKMDDSGLDFLNFDGPQSLRPTYRYKATLKSEIVSGARSKGYCNRKIYNVQKMYRWLTTTRNFKPRQPMWESTTRHISYHDRYGNTHTKEVISTDLTFKKSKPIPSGKYIVDGGKLYPISRENQDRMMRALVELGNPEMLLAHIVGITTGMRVQSNLTLRHGSITRGVGHDDDPCKYDLYGISVAFEDSLVEAKNSKEQVVKMPAWLHHMLHVYINSDRHRKRAAKSPITDDARQYIFLTRTGKPYYVAKADEHLFDFSTEKGSALRHFCKKVIRLVKRENERFRYQLHDLRATFGMNLIEDNCKDLESGKMNQIEILDIVKNRLNQEDINVTIRYLKYYQDHPRLAQAQSGFEVHLESLVRTEMTKNEQRRANRPPPQAGGNDE